MRGGDRPALRGDRNRSDGWDAIADRFMAIRPGVGTALVRAWARRWLAPSSTIADVGCGSGVPIARALAEDGFAISGVDASPALVAAFRRNLPGTPAACEPAQDSAFFGQSFAGAVSIGLLFLPSANDQRQMLGRIARALAPGGRFLFSAPRQACEWSGTLTGRISPGAEAYARHLDVVVLSLPDRRADEAATTISTS